MLHVAHERIEPSVYPRVSHGLLYLRDPAELEARQPSGLWLAQSVRDQILDAPVDVVPQLAIEIPFQLVASPAEEIEQLRHGHSAFSTLSVGGDAVPACLAEWGIARTALMPQPSTRSLRASLVTRQATCATMSRAFER